MKSTIKSLVLIFVITLSIPVSSCMLNEQREAVRSDLSRLCNSFPVPADFQKADEGGVIKPMSGSFSVYYGTDQNCRAAELVFYEFWNKNGWQPTSPSSPYYFKGNYVVSTSCGSGRFFDKTENLVRVNCSWDKDGSDKEILK